MMFRFITFRLAPALVALALASVLVGGPSVQATPSMGSRQAPVAVPSSAVAATVGQVQVTAVATGGNHTCVLTSGGGVKCWGWNAFGQLGNGRTTLRSLPGDANGLKSGVAAVAAGENHTCALTSAGGAKCWGSNGYGQLGDGTTIQRLTAVDVNGLTSGVTALVAGDSHTCALTGAGGVKCWGNNEYGQLGDGTTTARSTSVDVGGLGSGVAALIAGDSHTCAVTSAGGMKCWGYNFFGRLGDGTTIDRLTPADVSGLASGVAAAAAGDSHTCAVTSAGAAKCWGWNGLGQLGDDTATNRSIPVDVSGLTSDATAVAAGNWHTCVVTSGGGVKCWGDNLYGQLGNGATLSRSRTPVDVTGLASGVATLAAGGRHACVLTGAGGVKCWGDNGFGQLGNDKHALSRTPMDVVWPKPLYLPTVSR